MHLFYEMIQTCPFYSTVSMKVDITIIANGLYCQAVLLCYQKIMTLLFLVLLIFARLPHVLDNLIESMSAFYLSTIIFW